MNVFKDVLSVLSLSFQNVLVAAADITWIQIISVLYAQLVVPLAPHPHLALLAKKDISLVAVYVFRAALFHANNAKQISQQHVNLAMVDIHTLLVNVMLIYLVPVLVRAVPDNTT